MPRIVISGEITSKTAVRVINFSLKEEAPELNYIIMSEGGDMDSALAIIDVMGWLINEGKIVRTISLGKSHSAAAMIFAFGSERIVGPNSSIFFHQPNISDELPESLGSHRKYFYFESKRWVDFLKKLAARCGQDEAKFRAKVNRDMWLSPKEAVEFGVADRLL